ncbi:hypothetical protein HK101_008412 [Irineochytrium annulatum]|nr:hypothetical protein HK101_008412 [Irineochytrium annulatum]
MSHIIISRVCTSTALAAAVEIRRQVFVEEQHYPLDIEFDAVDDDPTTVHILATLPATKASLFVRPQGLPLLDVDDGGGSRVAIGTCRAITVPDASRESGCVDWWWKIERVAVVKVARGLGAGKELVSGMEKVLLKEQNEVGRFKLHAHANRKGFYERLGYVMEGGEFEEDGSTLVLMVKRK